MVEGADHRGQPGGAGPGRAGRPLGRRRPLGAFRGPVGPRFWGARITCKDQMSKVGGLSERLFELEVLQFLSKIQIGASRSSGIPPLG